MVVAGNHSQGVERNVVSIISHARYNRQTFENDIAILKVSLQIIYIYVVTSLRKCFFMLNKSPHKKPESLNNWYIYFHFIAGSCFIPLTKQSRCGMAGYSELVHINRKLFFNSFQLFCCSNPLLIRYFSLLMPILLFLHQFLQETMRNPYSNTKYVSVLQHWICDASISGNDSIRKSDLCLEYSMSADFCNVSEGKCSVTFGWLRVLL